MYDLNTGDIEVYDEQFAQPIRRIFSKVIWQVFEDLNSVDDKLRQSAMEWVMGGCEHMCWVCETAGRNPVIVREKAREVLDIPIQKRVRRGKVRGGSYQAVLEF